MLAAPPPGPLRATGLTVNGATDPVGVDPDDCSFAWTLQASGREVEQTSYRIVVRRTDPAHAGVVWDSGVVVTARQAFVAYAGTPLAADAAYEWTVRPRGYALKWGPVSAPARFTTALRAGDWQAQWLRPAGASEQPDRVTYLRTEVTPPAGALRRATAYISAAHPTACTSTGHRWTRWPSFSYPDEQYARAVDLTGAVAGGPRQRRRRAAPLVRARAGPTGVGSGPAVPAVAVVRGRPPRRGGLRRQLARAPGRVVAVAAAQRRRGRLRGMGRRARPSPGMVGPRLRRPLLDGGHRHRSGRQRALHPDLRAADDHQGVPGPSGEPPHRGRWRGRRGLRGQSTPPGPGWSSPRDSPGGRSPCGPGTCSTRTDRSPPCTARRRPNLSSPTSWGRSSQAFEAFTYFGFRYVQIDDAGTAARPGRQVVAITPACRHARGPPGDVLLGQPDAECGLAADSPLVPVLQPRAVRRHADPGEGPVPVGRANESEAVDARPTATRT